MGIGSFTGVKQPGRSVDHPPLSIAEVKERLYINYQLDALTIIYS